MSDASRILIDGRWVPARSTETRPITNPATLEPVGLVPECGEADVASAVEAAARAQPAWSPGPGCSTPGRCARHPSGSIWVEPIAQEFLRRLEVHLRSITVGDPMRPETDIGPLITEAAALVVERQVAESVRQGATLRVGGKRMAPAGLKATSSSLRF